MKVDRKILVCSSYLPQLQKSLGKVWTLMFTFSYLDNTWAHIKTRFHYCVLSTQGATKTCKTMTVLEESAFKYTCQLISHLYKRALLKAWWSSDETLWHNDGDQLSFLTWMLIVKRFLKIISAKWKYSMSPAELPRSVVVLIICCIKARCPRHSA